MQTGETVTIGGQNYTCTAVTVVSGHLDLVQGGALVIKNATVCVAQEDLPVEPQENTLAVFRANSLRVLSTDDVNGNLWSIMLVQEDA